MNKLCLVTGACGFNGSYMIELLLKNGYQVRATDLESTKDSQIYKNVIEKYNVEFMAADLTIKEDVKKIVKNVQYVFHIAALFSYSEKSSVLDKVNETGTDHLCSALVEEGKVEKFILWSSGSVYGIPDSKALPLREHHYVRPMNMYGKSKFKQELVVLKYCETNNFPGFIIRPVPIYGPRNHYGLMDVWMTFMKLPIRILPKKMPISFPYVHVEDVCGAALHIAENDKRVGNVYNVIDDSNHDVIDFFDELSQILNKKIIKLPFNYKIYTTFFWIFRFICSVLSRIIPIQTLIYFRETMNYSIHDFRFSNNKLKKLGYQLKHPTRKEAMAEVINWMHKHKHKHNKNEYEIEETNLVIHH